MWPQRISLWTVEANMECNPGTIGKKRNLLWFVRDHVSEATVRGKGAAIKYAKDTGRRCFLYRECECGCGRAAGRPAMVVDGDVG
jgi:hypothetical protein